MFDKKSLLTLVCIIFFDHADDKICIFWNNSLIGFFLKMYIVSQLFRAVTNSFNRGKIVRGHCR